MLYARNPYRTPTEQRRFDRCTLNGQKHQLLTITLSPFLRALLIQTSFIAAWESTRCQAVHRSNMFLIKHSLKRLMITRGGVSKILYKWAFAVFLLDANGRHKNTERAFFVPFSPSMFIAFHVCLRRKASWWRTSIQIELLSHVCHWCRYGQLFY